MELSQIVCQRLVSRLSVGFQFPLRRETGDEAGKSSLLPAKQLMFVKHYKAPVNTDHANQSISPPHMWQRGSCQF